MAKILLVEDDQEWVDVLTVYLKSESHAVEVVASGEDALQLLTNFTFDVVLLDWGLPGMSGLEVCRRYRNGGGTTPIIFLTSKSDIAEKEEGLDIGADDYMVKPLQLRELSARIRSVMRRQASVLLGELTIGSLVLQAKDRTLTVDGQSILLTRKECALLEYLMRHSGSAFTAEDLLKAVWPSESSGSVGSVRSWMAILRRKLAAAGQEGFIQTLRGSGYMIERK